MRLTETIVPPADYLPEVAPRKPYAARTPVVRGNDLAAALYKGWACESWAFRHWMTGHNRHVEHWHGESAPGSVR